MKQSLFVIVGAVLLSSSSFANVAPSIDQNSSLQALSSAWKSQNSTAVASTKGSIDMVYGGEDISRRPTLAIHTAIA